MLSELSPYSSMVSPDSETVPNSLVLVGHGTAWTLALAALTGAEPDLDRWAALRMPDVWTVEV